MSKFTALQTEVGFYRINTQTYQGNPQPVSLQSDFSTTLSYSLALTKNNVKVKILFIRLQERLEPFFLFVIGPLR